MLALSTFLGKIAYAKQMCSRLKHIIYTDFVIYFFSQIANFKQCHAGIEEILRTLLLRIAYLPKYFWQCPFVRFVPFSLFQTAYIAILHFSMGWQPMCTLFPKMLNIFFEKTEQRNKIDIFQIQQIGLIQENCPSWSMSEA